MDRQLCVDALTMSLNGRRPGRKRGSQYANHYYRAVLDANGMVTTATNARSQRRRAPRKLGM